MVDVGKILRQSKLRNTPGRSAVLELLAQKEIALSESDIEKSLPISCDRVTIYRTLHTFLEKGIIHKVLDDSGAAKYALCSGSCKYGLHNHDHVHFKCSLCGETVCMDEVPVPAITLPKGFSVEATNILMQGVCDKCH
ncbi:MAG: transcriptional repressor [Bacteroidota bacterium]